ncbi:MAG: amidohydrolase family protein [Terracidiphilus sp.]
MRRWVFRVLGSLVAVLLVFVSVVWVLQIYPRRVAHPALKLATGTLVLEHVRILVSPEAPPIEDGTVVVRDGRIAAVGRGVEIPAGAERLNCDHCTVAAGFWNAHVHFTQPRWAGAEWKRATDLNAGLADMLLSRGFTTVVDLGSNPADTLALRRRIEAGELAGPYIYSALAALYPPRGVPYYLRETLPGWLVAMMPQPGTPEEARRLVRRNLKDGADVTKLFTGSWVERGHVLPMPENIAAAAVETSHQNGALVFAHPSDMAGTRVAIDSGVDVLAHAANRTEGVDQTLLAMAVRRKMAMTPTLKMFATTVSDRPEYLDPIYSQVRQFHELGGQLLFGTDVGYMTDYSTEGEFEALGECGLGWRDVLAMLTTNPAAQMGALAAKGTVEPGKLADLTVLDADPAASLENFARVKMTIRSGRVVWQR